MKRSSWEAGEAGLASKSHRWPTQSKLANMSRAMSPYTSYWSIRVTMKLEVHVLKVAASHTITEANARDRGERAAPLPTWQKRKLFKRGRCSLRPPLRRRSLDLWPSAAKFLAIEIHVHAMAGSGNSDSRYTAPSLDTASEHDKSALRQLAKEQHKQRACKVQGATNTIAPANSSHR